MRMVGDWEGTQIRSHRRPIVVYAGDVYRLVPSIIYSMPQDLVVVEWLTDLLQWA